MCMSTKCRTVVSSRFLLRIGFLSHRKWCWHKCSVHEREMCIQRIGHHAHVDLPQTCFLTWQLKALVFCSFRLGALGSLLSAHEVYYYKRVPLIALSTGRLWPFSKGILYLHWSLCWLYDLVIRKAWNIKYELLGLLLLVLFIILIFDLWKRLQRQQEVCLRPADTMEFVVL